VQEVGDGLGVGLGHELVASGLELRAQLGEVLDDAVVHHGDPAVAVEVRMGVDVVGSAVRGPPGVPDAGVRLRHGLVGEELVEIGELAGLLRGDHPVTVDQRDAGGVVAAVLEASQAAHDHVESRAMAHVADDSAHGFRVQASEARAVSAAPDLNGGRHEDLQRSLPSRLSLPEQSERLLRHPCPPAATPAASRQDG
jgi:hypothetical protein